MTGPALIIEHATKRFGARTAVDDLSLAAPTGSIFGLLGPNGAGKSTMMRMVVGVLRPDAGKISVLGAAPRIGAMSRVGYLPEERGLYRTMTPHALITYFARLRGMSAHAARARATALLEQYGLGQWAQRRLKALSKGMAQKVQVLAAIAHDPDLLLFDEPFSGLDPVNQRAVEDLLRGAAARGATVLFSTHVMEHAERMCDAIVLIARGQSVFQGRVAEALALAPRAAHLETPASYDLAAALSGSGFPVDLESDAEDVRRWRVPLTAPDASRRLLAACVAAGAPLSLYEPQRATLHDAFVRLVGQDAAERAA